MDQQNSKSDSQHQISFRPITEGLGFHPFSDGLPYAPVAPSVKSPRINSLPSAHLSGLAGSAVSGAGAVSAGPQVALRPPPPRIAVPVVKKPSQTLVTSKVAPTMDPKTHPVEGYGRVYVLKRVLAYFWILL